MVKKYRPKMISITREMDDWLKEHRYISLSKLTQAAIVQEMKRQEILDRQLALVEKGLGLKPRKTKLPRHLR